MKTSISLANLSLILESVNQKAQDRLKEYMTYKYITLLYNLSKLCEESSFTLYKVANMLFYPHYTLEIDLEFKVYKIGDKTFSSKKPGLFIRLFKKVNVHSIKLSHQNIYLDDVILDTNEIKNLEIKI